MNISPEPAPTGLRMLFDLALAAGGQFIDGTLHLPASVGTGFIRLQAPEPGLMLAIHQCSLVRELVLKRVADDTQPETLLISFHAFGPAPPAAARPLSSAQIASTSVGLTTTLPAQTPVSIVAISIEKSLLTSWLPRAEDLPQALLTTRHPVVLDALLTPAIQAVLAEVAAPRPAHSLDAFFYKIKTQELLYWLLRELAARAAAPPRPLHLADVEKIYRVRTALLARLDAPPRLAGLAQAVGLSETKMKQLFRQVFGASPYAYFQAARMAEARRLLGHQSVSEVGYQLGFTNLSHFARLFAEHHGLTPKKYQATSRR